LKVNDYDSVRREVLNNIFTEFGVPMKLVRLIKTCLKKTHGKVHTGKHLSDSFPIQNGLKQGDDLGREEKKEKCVISMKGCNLDYSLLPQHYMVITHY
jgi:hypothetical protein